MSEDRGPELRLVTLTRMWLFSQSLHSVGRLPLWTPVSYRSVLWTAAVFLPAWALWALLGVGFDGPALTLRFLLPGLAVWWAVAQVGQGARPLDEVWSWVRWAARVVVGWVRGAGKVNQPVRLVSRARQGRARKVRRSRWARTRSSGVRVWALSSGRSC